MKPHFTPKQLTQLGKDICVIWDTREQKNDHITEWFDKYGILHRRKKLDTGDYNFEIVRKPEYEIFFPLCFTDCLFIEKKNSLSELASSITDKSGAFSNELKRAQLSKYKFLIVEQANGYHGIACGDYVNKYPPKSFMKAIHTLQVKYGLCVIFCDKQETASHIYRICSAVLDQFIEK